MPINYTNDLFISISNDGMTEDLWNLVNDDLEKINKFNIVSDKDRNLLFYIENFIDDLLEEFKIDISEKDNIISSVFKFLQKKENIDLTDIRYAVLLALKKNNKIAYPNSIGIGEANIKPQRNIDKWIKTLGEIYSAMSNGENKNIASTRIMEKWDPMEKLDFLTWVRYYENNDHEKYGLKRTATPFQIPTIPETPVKEELTESEIPFTYESSKPRKIPKTLKQTKDSLISRLDSAGRLLRDFANVWPPQVWNRLSEILSDLKREIIPLKTVATMNDRIIRTASLWDKHGFTEGADLLRKIAQTPEDDIASQIEKALTGRGFETDKTETPPMDMSTMETPPMETPPMETPPMETPPMETPPMETMPPAGVEEKMPMPEVMPTPTIPEVPQLEEKNEKEVMSIEEDDENPFKGKTVQDVLNILEPLSKKLSEREFVHSLSKADMILDSLNMASHFPELAEAQAKALDLNLYISTRIRSIINKLKGGLKNKKEKKETPKIEMEELTTPTQTEKTLTPPTQETVTLPTQETKLTQEVIPDQKTTTPPALNKNEKEMFEVGE